MGTIERPPHVESRRARVSVDSEGKKVLSVCVRCHIQKYILEDHTTCSDCRPKRKSRRCHAPGDHSATVRRQSWGQIDQEAFSSAKEGSIRSRKCSRRWAVAQ